MIVLAGFGRYFGVLLGWAAFGNVCWCLAGFTGCAILCHGCLAGFRSV